MPRVSQQPAMAATNAWQSRSNASVDRRPVLEGHTVESASVCGPRNPLLRALSQLGKLLSRAFEAVRPCGARSNPSPKRAAEQTRAQISGLLQRLVSGQSTQSTFTKDLGKLAEAHRRWAQLDPRTAADPQIADREFAEMVEDVLDQRWPGEGALVLARALSSPGVAQVTGRMQAQGEQNAEHTLMRLEAAVMRTIADRARDTLDNGFRAALVAIREGSLPSEIGKKANAAVSTGEHILDQLRDCGALESAAPRKLDQATRSRLEDAQTARILHDCIENSGATAHEIAALLQHLSPQSLLALRHHSGQETALQSAIELEIQTRPERLVEQLTLGSTARTRDRSSTIVSHTIGSAFEQVDDVKQQILDHCAIFGVRVPQGLREELNTFEHSLSELKIGSRSLPIGQMEKARDRADRLLDPRIASQFHDSWIQQVASLEQAATQRIHALLGQLDSGSTAAQLGACKELITAIRAVMRANGVEERAMHDPATRDRVHAELGRLLAPLLRDPVVKRQAPQLLAALRRPQMQTVAKVLSAGAAEAGRQNLPELQAELQDTCILLQTLTYELDDLVPEDRQQGAATSSSDLQPETRDQLAGLYSTVQQPDGRVTLTQGHFAREMEEILIADLQRSFSDGELECMEVGGMQIPSQFVTDAERNTQYFMDQGQPLIDRKGWDALSEKEKDTRIAEGYQRLVRFYQNNHQQTQAIVRLAHQGLLGGFMAASKAAAAHSPIVLEGYPPGYLSPTNGQNTWTSVHFSTGPNHRPRLEISYEVRGGYLNLLEQTTLPTGEVRWEPTEPEEIVYLDPERSRMRVTVVVEAHAGADRLTVVGKPVYDVHLVKAAIQRDYPAPEIEHLLTHSPNPRLYQDLIRYAEKKAPETVNGLRAMQAIVKSRAEPSLALTRVRTLYERHLRDAAPEPLAVDADLTLPVAESLKAIDNEVLHLFDEAMTDVRRRVAEYLPDWTPDSSGSVPAPVLARLREQGGEAARIADFVESVKVFTLNRNRTVEDAERIFGRFGRAGANDATPPLFSPEVIDGMRSGLQRVAELVEECTAIALDPLLQALTATAAPLLPPFTAALIDESRQADVPSNGNG